MFRPGNLLTGAFLGGLTVLTLATTVQAQARNRRGPAQSFRGTVVSVRSLAGQNGSVTIRLLGGNQGRGRGARAALGRPGRGGGMHTFHVNGATVIERNGGGRLPLRSVRRGEYLLVVANRGTARVIDVLGSGVGRRAHTLIRPNRRYNRNRLVARPQRFVRRGVVTRPAVHPLAQRRVVRRPTVVRPARNRPATVVRKTVVRKPPRPVVRKPARPPVKHALSKPVRKSRPAHLPAHKTSHPKGGRKR